MIAAMRESAPQLIGSSGDSLREAFGKALVELADRYPSFVVLDADIAGGTGVHHFRKARPDRFFQLGIAEQNMMALAGGFAATGAIPFVTTFAVFCLRALEQARLSVAYPKRNVKIVASHPGLDVGPDYMRTGRSPARRVLDADYRFALGRGRVLREGRDVTLVACGVEVARALDAAGLLSPPGISAPGVRPPPPQPHA